MSFYISKEIQHLQQAFPWKNQVIPAKEEVRLASPSSSPNSILQFPNFTAELLLQPYFPSCPHHLKVKKNRLLKPSFQLIQLFQSPTLSGIPWEGAIQTFQKSKQVNEIARQALDLHSPSPDPNTITNIIPNINNNFPIGPVLFFCSK